MAEQTSVTLTESSTSSASHDEITEQLLEHLAEPKRVEVDGQTVENHTLGETMDALRFFEAMKAKKNRRSGLSFGKFTAGGSVK